MFGAIYSLVTGRNPGWPRASKEYLNKHEKCVCCKQPSQVVHHVIPVHEDKDLEMVPENWAAMCDRCHFVVGHLCNWQAWNKNFWEVVGLIQKGYRRRIRTIGGDGVVVDQESDVF